MHRRGILKTAFVAGATALGCGRFVTPAAAQTKHKRLYVEKDIPPPREREMHDTFHNNFVRTVLQGTAPANHNYRFELEFESEELRQQWIASAGHQRVWPPIEHMMTTLKDYPVVLYDEV